MMVEKEEALNKLALELFAEYQDRRHYQVRYPWVLVRILSKEVQTSAGVWLLDSKNTSSPVYEGVVLQTWESFEETKSVWKTEAIYLTKGSDTPQDYRVCTDTVSIRKSQFKLGDHVIFPHWTGLPLPGLLPEEYRQVPELVDRTIGLQSNALIMGTVNREEPPVEDKLINWFVDNVNTRFAKAIAKDLLEDFDIIPKNQRTVLQPGRSRE
jgi:co-chaperonin GroES (HSP10)